MSRSAAVTHLHPIQLLVQQKHCNNNTSDNDNISDRGKGARRESGSGVTGGRKVDERLVKQLPAPSHPLSRPEAPVTATRAAGDRRVLRFLDQERGWDLFHYFSPSHTHLQSHSFPSSSSSPSSAKLREDKRQDSGSRESGILIQHQDWEHLSFPKQEHEEKSDKCLNQWNRWHEARDPHSQQALLCAPQSPSSQQAPAVPFSDNNSRLISHPILIWETISTNVDLDEEEEEEDCVTMSSPPPPPPLPPILQTSSPSSPAAAVDAERKKLNTIPEDVREDELLSRTPVSSSSSSPLELPLPKTTVTTPSSSLNSSTSISIGFRQGTHLRSDLLNQRMIQRLIQSDERQLQHHSVDYASLMQSGGSKTRPVIKTSSSSNNKKPKVITFQSQRRPDAKNHQLQQQHQRNHHKHKKRMESTAELIPSISSSQVLFASTSSSASLNYYTQHQQDWRPDRRLWVPSKSLMLSHMTPGQERRRIRVQFWIEVLSVSITIVGGMFIAATPLLLMLIFALPDDGTRDLLRILVFGSFLTAVLLIGLAGLLGNLYYYFDQRTGAFRFMLHCGSGPTDHFFGDSFFWPEVPDADTAVGTAGGHIEDSPVPLTASSSSSSSTPKSKSGAVTTTSSSGASAHNHRLDHLLLHT